MSRNLFAMHVCTWQLPLTYYLKDIFNFYYFFKIAIVDKAVEKWYGSERLLNLLDLFEPSKIIRDTLDLIGSFRYMITYIHVTE